MSEFFPERVFTKIATYPAASHHDESRVWRSESREGVVTPVLATPKGTLRKMAQVLLLLLLLLQAALDEVAATVAGDLRRQRQLPLPQGRPVVQRAFVAAKPKESLII